MVQSEMLSQKNKSRTKQKESSVKLFLRESALYLFPSIENILLLQESEIFVIVSRLIQR